MSRRGDETRALLVEAALAAVGRVGLRKTTLEDVAAEARVSRSTMYYHFDSKRELLIAVIDHLIDRLQQTVLDDIDPAAAADVRLVQTFMALAGEVQRLLTLYTVNREVAGELVPVAQKRIDRFEAWYSELLASQIRDGVDSGLFLVEEPTLLARTILNAFEGLFNPVINEDWEHMVEDSQRLLAVVMRGIAAHPTEEPPC